MRNRGAPPETAPLPARFEAKALIPGRGAVQSPHWTIWVNELDGTYVATRKIAMMHPRATVEDALASVRKEYDRPVTLRSAEGWCFDHDGHGPPEATP